MSISRHIQPCQGLLGSTTAQTDHATAVAKSKTGYTEAHQQSLGGKGAPLANEPWQRGKKPKRSPGK